MNTDGPGPHPDATKSDEDENPEDTCQDMCGGTCPDSAYEVWEKALGKEMKGMPPHFITGFCHLLDDGKSNTGGRSCFENFWGCLSGFSHFNELYEELQSATD